MPGAVPARRAGVDAAAWRAAFEQAAQSGARVGALWASDERDRGGGFAVHGVLVAHEGLLWLEHAAEGETYPGVADLFPAAARPQRAIADLMGLSASDLDARGWLRHGGWRPGDFSLRVDVASYAEFPPCDPRYAFAQVEGEGVHEIAVGPVHAGIIEPGHFRFSVVGERVLRLEERLGYKHKGIEKLFEKMQLQDGARLAARVSGDSTVAFSWAYAMALETAAGIEPPPRALWLRALLLERERIANHLGDLGALGNDGGLAFGLAQFSRLKEALLRPNRALFGHRYLMDRVAPGGVAVDLDAAGAAALLEESAQLDAELAALRAIYYDHAGLQDRCINCGRLAPRTAAALGVVGFAARASGIAIDARLYPGFAPYGELQPRVASHRNGDVAARIVVRFEELFESLKLERRILAALPATALAVPLPGVAEGARGIGWVEGWRGEVIVALEAGGRGGACPSHPPPPFPPKTSR